MSFKENTKSVILSNTKGFSVDFASHCRVNGSRKILITCCKCNITVYKTVNSLVKSQTRCDNCYDSELMSNLFIMGFNLIAKCGEKVYMECMTCGSITFRQRASSRSGRIFCKDCHHILVVSKLNNAGCKFVAYRSGSKYGEVRVEYTTSDGHTNICDKKSIIDNVFSKQKTEGSYSVYMFYKNFNELECPLYLNPGLYLKIGIAKDPERRLKVLCLDFDCNIEVLKVCKNRKDARSYEKYMHNMFSFFKLDKVVAEIFTNRRSSTRLKTGKRHKMKDGATEWFFIYEETLNFIQRNKDFARKLKLEYTDA